MNLKQSLLGFAVLMSCMLANAQNPIIRDQFTADPTARVFNGKMYVYPSHDIHSPVEHLKEWFCMADYHVFSSENLTDWTDHGVIVSQENVPWVRPESYSMWAPDCVCKDGRYYFYFPSAPKGPGMRGFSIGVAVSDSPEGPFMPMWQPIKGVFGIDPCVLVDKDGQSYIYWSGMGMRMAKLKDNMMELDSEPKIVEGLPDGFKEGPFVFEREGNYYYTFPWVRDTTKTETLAYAMGKSPMGPFEFKGLIMEESPTGCWTNHHSIVEYKGEWYLFYHHNDYSPSFDKNRSARIDRVFFNEDGTIQEVIPTLRGVGPVKASSQVHIDRYSSIDGAYIEYVDTSDLFKGWKTVFAKAGDSVRFDDLDFGKKAPKKVVFRAKSPDGCKVAVTAGERAEFVIPSSLEWTEFTLPMPFRVRNIQNLEVELLSEGTLEVDWIKFI